MTRHSAGAFWLLFGLAALAAALPFAVLENAPLVDAPNHYARFHILAELERSDRLETISLAPLDRHDLAAMLRAIAT